MEAKTNTIILKYDSQSSGNAASGYKYNVISLVTGELAELYSDNGVTRLGQPVVSDQNGMSTIYAKNGRYKIELITPGMEDIPDFTMYDPLDDPSGDMAKAVYDPENINLNAFNRDNHTGSQAISTVTDLQSNLDKNKVFALSGIVL
tara:strand:+ start:1124 stop:1564 length:441 start_codon:yes stop_codon:yes gene_type:complete